MTLSHFDISDLKYQNDLKNDFNAFSWILNLCMFQVWFFFYPKTVRVIEKDLIT